MKCRVHLEKYIWFSESDKVYYCNKCIDKMIRKDIFLTSNNWDSLYEYYINILELEGV